MPAAVMVDQVGDSPIHSEGPRLVDHEPAPLSYWLLSTGPDLTAQRNQIAILYPAALTETVSKSHTLIMTAQTII